MAYAQQPQYDTLARSPYQSHQLSYGPSREPYAAKTGCDSIGQAEETYGSSRRGPTQQYSNSNEPSSDTYGYNEGHTDQDNFHYGANRRYGGRGQNGVERWPPPQQPQGRPIDGGLNLRNNPRHQGPFSSRGRHGQQDPYHQSNPYREPQSKEPHYRAEGTYHNGSHMHQNGEYGYEEFALQTPDSWTPMQHFNRPSHSDGRAYEDPEYSTLYSQQDQGGPYNRRELEASAYTQNFQQLKHSTDKVSQAPITPDKVAWDNPFPTFPMRPSRAQHANSRGPDDTTALMGLHEERTEKLKNNDLQHYSDTSPLVILEANPNSRGGEYFDPRPQPERDAVHYRGTAQDKLRARDAGHHGAPLDQSKPITNSRRSEDSRLRPSLPLDTKMDVGYERSRTMPIALSEAALVSRRPSHQSTWQEPGSIAGYHGRIDNRGHTPNSPIRSRQGSFPHSGDGGRPTQIGAVVHAQSTDSRQPHAQNDSLGEFFDTYYDAPQDEQQQYLQSRNRQHLAPAHEDTPKFHGEPAPTDGRRRQIVDGHLLSQSGSPDHLPVPRPPREDVRRFNRHDPSPDAIHPRSRSQPNFKDRRSPRQPLDEGFNFGVPGTFDRPPATAPARHEYGVSANSAMTSFTTRLDLYPQDRQYLGPTRADGHRPKDYNVADVPAPVAPLPGQISMAYQSHTPSERYRSPPVRDGGSPQLGPRSDRPTPTNNRTHPPSPTVTSRSNPDALPSHPAPVRPGLLQSSPLNQAPKPAPLRQYNSTPSPMQSSSPSKVSGLSSSTDTKRESVPVTHQELERLKQITTKNPEDQKSQLILAKKMVEAASVLVDERTDPRTRNKSREKYILDAHKIVKKISNNGYSEATFYLADAYSRGSLGLECDTREAFKLYQSAAKAGHAQAAYRVAVCCEIGHEEGGGTSRDAVKAMQWYRRAATLGDTPAMYKMGIISLKGLLGQPKNPKEAVVWLKRAAERADEENPHALHELALLHEKPSSNEGVTKDEAYSKQLFAEAADLGYKFSQFRLGCAYEYGLMGCPVDPRQSIAWYSKAAVQGEHQSELALSGWYLTGSEGVLQQSDTEAYLWARKAAQSGLAKAEYAMGYFTEVGIGAPANLEDAKRWYWKSASQGFDKARGRLEELRRGNPVKQKTRVSRSAMRKNSEGECTIM